MERKLRPAAALSCTLTSYKVKSTTASTVPHSLTAVWEQTPRAHWFS